MADVQHGSNPAVACNLRSSHMLPNVFGLLSNAWLDIQVVMAWSADTCILSFRGTSSFTNVLADLQVRHDVACS